MWVIISWYLRLTPSPIREDEPAHDAGACTGADSTQTTHTAPVRSICSQSAYSYLPCALQASKASQEATTFVPTTLYLIAPWLLASAAAKLLYTVGAPPAMGGAPGMSRSMVVRGLEGLRSTPSERQVRLIRAASVWITQHVIQHQTTTGHPLHSEIGSPSEHSVYSPRATSTARDCAAHSSASHPNS